KALEEVLANSTMHERLSAIKALGVWGKTENVPALLKLLSKKDGAVRHAAIESLTKIKDASAVDALADRLTEFMDQNPVRKALEAFGSTAEPAVLRYLQHSDPGIRVVACEILKVIGTNASVLALRQ